MPTCRLTFEIKTGECSIPPFILTKYIKREVTSLRPLARGNWTYRQILSQPSMQLISHRLCQRCTHTVQQGYKRSGFITRLYSTETIIGNVVAWILYHIDLDQIAGLVE